MEPTDDGSVTKYPQSTKYIGYCKFDIVKASTFIESIYKSVTQHCIRPIALRLRGSGFERLHDKEYSNIPKLTQMGFKWNGLPMPFFMEKVMYPLNMGLGSVTQDKYSLLANAQNRDPGAPGPMAPAGMGRAVATPQMILERDLRSERTFCCILNYIDSNCMVYKMYIELFQFTGCHVYNHMLYYGTIRIPPKMKETMESAWNHMTMETCKIPKSANGILKWAETVIMQGERLNKTAQDQKVKFLAGLPAFMEADVAVEQKNNTLVHGANYGPGFPAFLRVIAHPHANGPDVMAIARALYNAWMKKLIESGRLQHGLIRSAIDEDAVFQPDEDLANLTVEQISDATRCFECGGDKHAATQWHGDEKIVCAAKRIKQIKHNGDTPSTSASGAVTPSMSATRDGGYKKKAVRFENKYNKAKQLVAALVKRERARVADSSDDGEQDFESSHTSDDAAETEDEEVSIADDVPDDLFEQIAESGLVARKEQRKPKSAMKRRI